MRSGVVQMARPGRGRARRAVLLATILALAACGYDDPFQRSGTWSAEGLNNRNIAAMVTDPRQLSQGVGDPHSPGVLSNAAIDRLLTDHLKRLPTTLVGPISPTSTGGAE